jgi:hypothetical protein
MRPQITQKTKKSNASVQPVYISKKLYKETKRLIKKNYPDASIDETISILVLALRDHIIDKQRNN